MANPPNGARSSCGSASVAADRARQHRVRQPHNATVIPPDVRRDIVLTDAERAAELRAMTDAYTAERFVDDTPERTNLQAGATQPRCSNR